MHEWNKRVNVCARRSRLTLIPMAFRRLLRWWQPMRWQIVRAEKTAPWKLMRSAT